MRIAAERRHYPSNHLGMRCKELPILQRPGYFETMTSTQSALIAGQVLDRPGHRAEFSRARRVFPRTSAGNTRSKASREIPQVPEASLRTPPSPYWAT